MNNILFDLVGKTIYKILKVEDYLQLYFDRDIMSIFNPVTYYLSKKVVETDLDRMIGKKVIEINYMSKVYLEIKFDDFSVLKISLLDKDFIGPEAISIKYITGEMLIID